MPGLLPGRDERLSPDVLGARRVFCCHSATLSRTHPPNSLAAVVECVESRVPRLEVDVRFLADDAMLVFHDAHLDAGTNGAGPVSAIDRAAAAQLHFRDFPDAPLCFLEEVVDALCGASTLLQVDLKPMRLLPPARLRALARALEPVRDRVLIGSQAHWNLRGLHEAGYAVALDPTLQWHYRAVRAGEGLVPARLGVHGLWDDAPLAHIPSVSALDYLAARTDDLVALLPAVEWMVDYETLLYMDGLGFPLGERLAERGVELAAWTLRDEGARRSQPLLQALFKLGATTVITDDAAALAAHAAGLA
jgi:glycerophosphoryl diester phosphodiesterase